MAFKDIIPILSLDTAAMRKVGKGDETLNAVLIVAAAALISGVFGLGLDYVLDPQNAYLAFALFALLFTPVFYLIGVAIST